MCGSCHTTGVARPLVLVFIYLKTIIYLFFGKFILVVLIWGHHLFYFLHAACFFYGSYPLMLVCISVRNYFSLRSCILYTQSSWAISVLLFRVVEGSNDGGSSWRVLDEQFSQRFETRFQRKTFKINSVGLSSNAFR